MSTVAERRVMRQTRESTYINTINVADRVAIHFVWFPGPHVLASARIDTLVVAPDAAGNERTVEWSNIAGSGQDSPKSGGPRSAEP